MGFPDNGRLGRTRTEGGPEVDWISSVFAPGEGVVDVFCDGDATRVITSSNRFVVYGSNLLNNAIFDLPMIVRAKVGAIAYPQERIHDVSAGANLHCQALSAHHELLQRNDVGQK